MNEEPGTPLAPILAKAERRGTDAMWLRTLDLMRKNKAATLLPLAVTQMPFAVVTACVFFYLFFEPYPDARFDSFNWLADAPGGLRLTMVLGAAQSLFSLVGASATMVAVAGLINGKPLTLAQSLDPAFTRMGGLLLFGAVFNFLLLASAVGFIVLLYFVVRFGLGVQAYILEGTSVWGSFGRSWKLLKGRMLSFVALLLTTIPVGLLLLLATSLVFGIAAAPFGDDAGRTTELAFQSIALFIVGAALVPVGAYLATSTTLFYLSAKEQSGA